jgi:cell division protein FtsW
MKRALVNSGSKVQARPAGTAPVRISPDYWILVPALLLICCGLVMVGSASVAVAEGQGVNSWYYLARHAVFIAIGITIAFSLRIIPIAFFERISRPMMLLAMLALLLVLVPGLGHTVNGSTRWIKLGLFNFQVIEAVKVMVIIYLADYLARKTEMLQSRFFP